MRIRILGTGLALCMVGLGVFAWKVLVLELPILPAEPQGLWQVGLRVSAVPGADAFSLDAAMPSPDARQFIFGERFSSGRLRLGVRDEATGRRALWRGTGRRGIDVDLLFRVQLAASDGELPVRNGSKPVPEEIRRVFTAPSSTIPSTSSEIGEVLSGIELPRADDVGGRVRSIYAFVVHETRTGRTDDPILTLRDREGNDVGRERLLVAMLRRAEIPARLVRGLELDEPRAAERVWAEVWVDGWVALSATRRFVGSAPLDYLALSTADRPLVSGNALRSIDYEFAAIRERLSPQELATLMMPSEGVFEKISLHRLPVGLQAGLRLLLLMPLGALILTLLRNVVGLPSYGTFMPMLIALALRGTGLGIGLALILLVLLIGVAGRLLVTKLRLLLVPRLSFLLCVVVASVTAMALIGFDYDDRNFYAGLVFPIVILTMLIERFSITLSEEGFQPAAVRAGSSVLLAIMLYPLFSSAIVEHVMFSFPEWILVVMGVLVWLGGYTGYRVTDVIRFRSLASRE
ncbi:MAG: UUP1 family membrane protein [bacterium]|nr:UUP1 family membrane protein [bacterium]